jgi:cytochrome P450
MTQANADMSAGVGRADWERRTTHRTGAGQVVDPYPLLADMRRAAPVHRGSFFEHFGVPDPTKDVWPGAERFVTLGYAETEQVLRDNIGFSNAGIHKMTEYVFGEVSLMGADDPEHRKFRALVQPAFGRKGLCIWSQFVRPRLDELIDRFESRGAADLYFEYCAEFPVYVIAMVLGVARADLERFHEWAAMLQIAAATPDEARAARLSVEAYMREIIADRRANPRDDIVTMLLDREIEEDGVRHKITERHILGLICNLLPAGSGTTYRSLGILLVTLLERPELLARLYGERDMIPRVVDELLRWNGPVLVAPPRLATRDAIVGGVEIPAGSIVEAGIAAANRDPERFADPDRFDADRDARITLAFSTGPHFCVGSQVARMELVSALNALLDRLPGLRFDPDRPRPEITGLWYRMPTGVPVVWG